MCVPFSIFFFFLLPGCPGTHHVDWAGLALDSQRSAFFCLLRAGNKGICPTHLAFAWVLDIYLRSHTRLYMAFVMGSGYLSQILVVAQQVFFQLSHPPAPPPLADEAAESKRVRSHAHGHRADSGWTRQRCKRSATELTILPMRTNCFPSGYLQGYD